MTLDTRIYVKDQVDYREVFLKCNQLIGAHEGIKFTDEPVPHWENGERKRGSEDGIWAIGNGLGQGLCALLDINYRKGRPLYVPGDHYRYCEPIPDERTNPCATPCWLEVSFDTAYGYQGDNGEGCGDLHARLVAELGRWLDGKHVRWSWKNEFTGDVHDGYDGLDELGAGGLKALEWFARDVMPVIAGEVDR